MRFTVILLTMLVAVGAGISLQNLQAQPESQKTELAVHTDVTEGLKTDISEAVRQYIAGQYPQNRADLYPALAQTCDIEFSDDLKSGTILCEAIKGTLQTAKPSSKSLRVQVSKGGVTADLYYKITLEKNF